MHILERLKNVTENDRQVSINRKYHCIIFFDCVDPRSIFCFVILRWNACERNHPPEEVVDEA